MARFGCSDSSTCYFSWDRGTSLWESGLHSCSEGPSFYLGEKWVVLGLDGGIFKRGDSCRGESNVEDSSRGESYVEDSHGRASNTEYCYSENSYEGDSCTVDCYEPNSNREKDRDIEVPLYWWSTERVIGSTPPCVWPMRLRRGSVRAHATVCRSCVKTGAPLHQGSLSQKKGWRKRAGEKRAGIRWMKLYGKNSWPEVEKKRKWKCEAFQDFPPSCPPQSVGSCLILLLQPHWKLALSPR